MLGERLAEHPDMILQRVPGGAGQFLSPHSVEQVLDTHDASAGEGQKGQDRPQLRASGGEQLAPTRSSWAPGDRPGRRPGRE